MVQAQISPVGNYSGSGEAITPPVPSYYTAITVNKFDITKSSTGQNIYIVDFSYSYDDNTNMIVFTLPFILNNDTLYSKVSTSVINQYGLTGTWNIQQEWQISIKSGAAKVSSARTMTRLDEPAGNTMVYEEGLNLTK